MGANDKPLDSTCIWHGVSSIGDRLITVDTSSVFGVSGPLSPLQFPLAFLSFLFFLLPLRVLRIAVVDVILASVVAILPPKKSEMVFLGGV